MTAIPNNFLALNNHRIVLFQPDNAHADFDRIEDVAADAIAAARAALASLEHLPHETLKPIDGSIRTIRTHVDQRRVLSDDFQQAALFVLNHVAKAEAVGEATCNFHGPISCLQDALKSSHRVRDLLAAEKDIGLHRGIRG